MSNWQDISTAPKDGTYVLLTGGANEYDEVCAPIVAAYWIPEFRDWIYAHWDLGPRSCYIDPTHWMPLPEPPQ